jgi:hypothetical protein
MKRMIVFAGLLAGILLCGLMLPAQSAPSLEGYTGLLLTPTADALGEKDYNAAFFTLNVEDGADSDTWAGNLGLADGVELGIARVKPEGAPGETLLNAKYRIRSEDGEHPAFAVGVIDATDEIDTTAYFVASKTLTKVVKPDGALSEPRLHIGIGGGALDGFFAGVSIVVADNLTLIAEYDTEDVNLGARLAVGHGLRIHGGWIHDLDDVALGVSYNKAF